ncbi:hypothetical protein ASD32_10955 [Rhizobium sp. Root483D2]|nr:hypothetical protein ASD32_10955 [Rhizobium sp. Root483D2]
MYRNRDVMSDCRVRTIPIVVSTPSLQLFAQVRKGQEPVRVQAFGPQLAVERFNEAIVGRFAWPRDVKCDLVDIGPKVQIAGDKLAAIIDTDRVAIAGLLTDTVQRLNDILAAIGNSAPVTGR